MATKDPTKANVRFSAALRRITEGLKLQHSRIVSRNAQATTISVGPDYDIIDLRGDAGNDIDYYVYELARLQDLAKAVNEAFGDPPEVVEALADFEAAIPALREIRNPLTHPSDDARLDDVAWFDSVVKLRPDGDVDYLVDPRYSDHDKALEFSSQLCGYLQADVGATTDAPSSSGAPDRS